LKEESYRRQASQLARLHPPIARPYLGVVEAPDLRAAEATAARTFKLSTEDRRRLAVRELD